MSEFSKEIEDHISATQERIKTVTDKLEKLGSLVEGLARAREQLGKTESALGPAIGEIKNSASSLQDLARSVSLLRDGYEQMAQAIQTTLRDSDFAQIKTSVDTLCSDVAKFQTAIYREFTQASEQINNQYAELVRSAESIIEENNRMRTMHDKAFQTLHLQQKRGLKIVMVTAIASATIVLGVIVYLHYFT